MIVVDAALLAHYVGSAYISINPTLYTPCQAPISRQYFNICLGLLPFIAHKRVLNSMRNPKLVHILDLFNCLGLGRIVII